MSEKSPASYAQVAYDLAQRHEAQRLFAAFADAGVPVIGLKGIVFKGDLYAPAEQRPMYDIDVLVHREDIARAGHLLEGLGYTFFSDGDYKLDFACAFMGEVPYKKGSVVVELHWHLVSMTWNRRATAFDLKGMWQRAARTERFGSPVLRLSLEDELLYLCYHLAVPHSLFHPSSLNDIERLLSKHSDTIDWSLVVNRAHAWKISVACWAALARVQRAMPDIIPVQTLDAFRVGRWRQKLVHRVLQASERSGTVLVSDQKRFLGLLLVDDLSALPRVLVGGLFPGRQWLKTRYNLSKRAAFWRQWVYPFEVVFQGMKALTGM